MINPIFYLCALLLLKGKYSKDILDNIFFFKKPIIIIFSLIGPIYLGAFGPIWSTGLIGQSRSENLASCFFCIAFTFVIIANKDCLLSKIKFRLNTTIILPFFIALLLLWENQGILFMELTNGEINAFAKEMESRIEKLENNRDIDVYLPAIQHQSKTLFVYPLTDSPSNWQNQCYSNY